MVYTPRGIKKLFHNTRRLLARRHLKGKRALQIGITGSQGKTNTTHVLAEVLKPFGTVLQTDVNLDSTFNVPITALKVRDATDFVLWELGIDHPGEMDRHLEIARPVIGIITGISAVHTDAEHMGSIERLIAEKRKLIEALPPDGFALLNWDDPNVRGMAPYTKAAVLSFGTTPEASVYTHRDEVRTSLTGTELTIHDGGQKISLRSGLVGVHHIYNIMAGYLVFKTAVIKGGSADTERLELFRRAIAGLSPLPGRMSVEDGPRRTVLLNDSLRASPASTRFGLLTLAEIKEPSRKKIAVLAEMGELDKAEEEHARLGRDLAALPIDFTVCIGPLQKHTFEAALRAGKPKETIVWVPDVFEAANALDQIIKPGDIIYLKGSLLKHVERVLLLLQGERVGCTVVSCPFYRRCAQCKYLRTGYQHVA